MKEKESELLKGLSHDDGMRVPEGYFADFANRMQSMLPEQPWESQADGGRVMPRTMWQKIRPYVYMAAMFMGVWCMMKMMDLMRPSTDNNYPAMSPVLAEAMNDETFINDYYISDVDETDILDQLYDEGFTTASLIPRL